MKLLDHKTNNSKRQYYQCSSIKETYRVHKKLSPSISSQPRRRQLQVQAASTTEAPATPPPPPSSSSPPQAPPETKYQATIQTTSISSTISTIRIICTDRLPEIEFNLKKGTTTNTYLLSHNSKYETLIDVPSKVFDIDFVDALKQSGALQTLQRIVITRLSPERIPVLKAVLAACNNRPMHIYATTTAVQLLKDKATSDPELSSLLDNSNPTIVTRGYEVPLGGGKGNYLRFVPISTPRWPDLVAVYSAADKALFSSNFFSARVASTSVTDEGGWDVYGDDWKHYYDCLLAPVAKQTAKALERLAINAVEGQQQQQQLGSSNSTAISNSNNNNSGGGPLGSLFTPLFNLLADITLGADDGIPDPITVSTILPMHGPIIQSTVTEILGRYADYTAAQVKALSSATALVMFASAYGNTASLAQAISRGLTKSGVGVETLNLEVVSADEVEAALERAAGFVIGSPTLGGHMPTQVQTALGATMRCVKSKTVPCGVFGSFGWSGEAVDMMEGKLKDAGFRFAFDAIRVKFKPTEAVLQMCEESGTDLAQAIKKEAKKREKTAAAKLSVTETTTGRAQALGRVVGSLCVVTAKDGDASSAMLASWVSQASFDPPGITVAVKKDRAIESLLPIGAKFVMNVLAEGKEKSVLKQLAKQFAPGEDRFVGLAVQESEASGAYILPEVASSYLECSVVTKMEAGDHFIVYAQVDDGKVVDEGSLSAVHFRKVATNY